jgi:hypothetical protein
VVNGWESGNKAGVMGEEAEMKLQEVMRKLVGIAMTDVPPISSTNSNKPALQFGSNKAGGFGSNHCHSESVSSGETR